MQNLFCHIWKHTKKIMDIGCGNGRDSIYFSQNGLEVTGVDASEEAISYLNQYNMKNSMFVCDDFVTCKSIISGSV